MEHINIVLGGIVLLAIMLSLGINRYYTLKNNRNKTRNPSNDTNSFEEGGRTSTRKRRGGSDLETHEAPTTEQNYPLLTLHIFAKPNQKFAGYELLQALLAVGLRFGEMNIFHRYKTMNATRGPILFSLTCATKPGTFDIPNIGSFSCSGLSLFMQLSKHPSSDRKRFELMLETAQQLAEELGGEVYDHERDQLTSEALEHWRAYVSDELTDMGMDAALEEDGV